MSYGESGDENFNLVTKLLLSLKFQPQMQGFDYIRSAVLYYLNNDISLSSGITTEVYPMLAKKYNTREESIERNIRKIIESAYNSGGLLTINQYYDAIVYTNSFKYSNSEIIAILVEIIKLDKLKRKICKKIKSYDCQ